MDGRFTPAQQNQFLTLGKILRAKLTLLLGAIFNAGTPAVMTANTDIATMNAYLTNAGQVLANSAATLNNITQLVGLLDQTLSLAAKIV